MHQTAIGAQSDETASQSEGCFFTAPEDHSTPVPGPFKSREISTFLSGIALNLQLLIGSREAA